jgi:hypothetical protein
MLEIAFRRTASMVGVRRSIWVRLEETMLKDLLDLEQLQFKVRFGEVQVNGD